MNQQQTFKCLPTHPVELFNHKVQEDVQETAKKVLFAQLQQVRLFYDESNFIDKKILQNS